MFKSCVMVLLAEEEETKNSELFLIRRKLRDESNPLELPSTIFQQYFRVNKPVFKYLLDILRESLAPSKKVFAIPTIVKLTSCLRFFAEGGYQKGVGKEHDIGLAQSSFSLVLSEVLRIFEEKLCPIWIKMNTTHELTRTTKLSFFFEKFGIPGVLGCVDGTHVSLNSPPRNKHCFYNRKGFFSLNVLLVNNSVLYIKPGLSAIHIPQVCDHEMRINFIDATHPGASHDALIWKVIELRAWLEQQYVIGERNFWLLGDAGYPLEPWLLTPFRSFGEGSPESRFNVAHKRCRNIIERTNGVLKNRWRCLIGSRALYYLPDKATQIINVCSALHNICIHYKADLSVENRQETLDVDEANSMTHEIDSPNDSVYLAEGQRIRRQIAAIF